MPQSLASTADVPLTVVLLCSLSRYGFTGCAHEKPHSSGDDAARLPAESTDAAGRRVCSSSGKFTTTRALVRAAWFRRQSTTLIGLCTS